MPLLTAPRGSALRRALRARPEIWGMVMTPYVSRRWDAGTRLRRIADHCRTLEQLGPRFDMDPNGELELMRLPQLGSGFRVVLDQFHWMIHEGALVFNLFHERQRLFSLSFSLSSQGGERVAYIGGLQGVRHDGILDIYRSLTKEAHGMRPRDLTVELFKGLCRAIGVTRILAVSDDSRHQNCDYFRQHAPEVLEAMKLSYDEVWLERSAAPVDEEFFSLPCAPTRRAAETIPARKRSLYRQRYAMLDAMDLALAVAAGVQPIAPVASLEDRRRQVRHSVMRPDAQPAYQLQTAC